jgi:cell division protein FtsW
MFRLFGTNQQKSQQRRGGYQPRVSNSREQGSSALADNSAITRKHKPDYMLIIIALLLAAIGLVVVYAISPGLAATKNVDTNYFVIKQSVAIVLGLIAFVIFSTIPLKVLAASRNILVGVSALAAVAVLVVGEEVNGASRWIQVGGLSFQVAELFKFTLIVWLAAFLVEKMQKGEIANDRKTLKILSIILVITAVVVGKVESDLGSLGVMIAIMGVMSFVAGLPLKKVLIAVSIISLLVAMLIFTTPYRRARVHTFLNPTSDCQASGYQACQALIAIGSGGVFGLGLGNGVQAYGYLPEAANDSIFAILAEKFGFLGVSIVLSLYLFLFSRFKRIIERTKEPFERLFVTGVMAWLSTQTIINIGAMIGLLPLKGITLPFVSYGGTSILFVMAALGIVFHISKYTSFEAIRNSKVKEQGSDDRSVRRGVRRPYYASTGSRS